jgi:hypothetical protein
MKGAGLMSDNVPKKSADGIKNVTNSLFGKG